MNKGDLAIEKGNMDNAREEYDAALKMLPENLEMIYWVAVSLANQKKIKEALILFERVFKKDENWRLLTERLPDSELLNVSEEDMKKILSLK